MIIHKRLSHKELAMKFPKLVIILLFCITSTSHAEPLQWYEHPGYWFKNVFYSPNNGSPAPEITTVDLNGNQISLDNYAS